MCCAFALKTEARAANGARTAYLFKPATAVRVRFGTNDPTPWPPELPAGENPMPGGIIDYSLASNATAPVKLEILDAAGKVVRHYSSADPVLTPHPAIDSAAYNRVCQQNPRARDCGLPLYWPAPPILLSSRAGFHRFSWDLHFDPIGAEDPNAGGESATGAVPRHTYDLPYSPWAPPGAYTVRLTVDGKSYTQPLTLRLDPRVKTPAAGLAQLASLTREMYDGAVAAHGSYEQARALAAQLDRLGGDDIASFKAKLDSLAPPAPTGGRGGRGFGGGRGRGGGGSAPATLQSVSDAMLAAAMAMQGADVAPTANDVAAAARARSQATDVMRRWNALKTTGLAALNAKRKAAGQAAITPPGQ
jgi:hypothetical protein